MAKSTGPGKVEVISRSPLSVLFYNFDIGGDVVKVEHMSGLFQHIVPVLDAGGSATLVGMASRTGSEALNIGLAKGRAVKTLGALARIVGDTGKAAHAKLGVSEGSAAAARAGDKAGAENPKFRACVVSAWLQRAPPKPVLPDGSTAVDLNAMPEVTVGDYMNPATLIEAGVSTGFSLAELIFAAGWIAAVATPIMAILDSVFNILGLIWAWKSADELAHFNGWVRGFIDGWQEMANAYSDPKLDPNHPEKWPAIPHPAPKFEWNVPDSALMTSQQEDRRGRREGAEASFKAIQELENNPKDLVIKGKSEIHLKGTGKVVLWVIYQARKGDVSGGILELINKKLHEKGKGDWPLS
jgi:hypothetical protein